MQPSLPPSTAKLTPLIYPAEGDAKKAMAFAVSCGLPNRPAGIELFMVSDTTSTEIFSALDFASINEDNLGPQKILRAQSKIAENRRKNHEKT